MSSKLKIQTLVLIFILSPSSQAIEWGKFLPWGNSSQAASEGPTELTFVSDPKVDPFVSNLTERAQEGKIKEGVGLSEYVRKLDESFQKATNKAVSIVAPRGAGKTALIETYAQHLYDSGSNRVILLLDAKSLVGKEAGAQDGATVVSRMRDIVNYLKKNQNVTLFIDEVQFLFQANKDAIEVLKEPLARGEISLGTATTDVEYREFVEKDGAWIDRFNGVTLPEMNQERLVTILESYKESLEKAHGVRILSSAIEEIAKQTLAQFPSDSPARKALDLMDRMMVREKLEMEMGSMEAEKIKDQMQTLSKRLENLNADLEIVPDDKATLENKEKVEARLGALQETFAEIELKDLAKKRLQDLPKLQAALNKAVSDSPEYRVLREEIGDIKHLAALAEVKEAPAGALNKINVLKFVQAEIGIPMEILNEEPAKHFERLESHLKFQLVGQDRAVKEMVGSIKISRTGVAPQKGPAFTLLLVGGPGLGKDTSADIITEVREGKGVKPLTVNFNQMDHQTSRHALFGIEPGYKDSEMGGKFDALRRRANATVYLNEVDKAGINAWQSLLQVLEQGLTEDARGRKLDFRNAGVIMSANWGKEYSVEKHVLSRSEIAQKYGLESGSLDGVSERQMDRLVIEKIMLDSGVPPEFVNRVKGGIVVLDALSFQDTVEVARRLLERREAFVQTQFGVDLKIHSEVAEMVARMGYSIDGGARLIQSSFNDTITEILADAKVDHPEIFQDGKTLEITFTKNAQDQGGTLSLLEGGRQILSKEIQLGVHPQERLKDAPAAEKEKSQGRVGKPKRPGDAKEIIKDAVKDAKKR
jgi:ATP-dependent Clp protease ATP-binding subunit ClpA